MIDAFTSHQWADVRDLEPYLEKGWGSVLMRNSHHPIRTGDLYINPRTRHALREHEGATVDGMDYDAFATQVLDATGAERVVLGYEAALSATAFANPFLSMAVARGVNDWSADRWLNRDDRLYGLAMIPTGDPAAAAEEIRRVAANPKFVGLALGANVLGVPYGNLVYDPIWAAAAETGLPIVFHAKADNAITLAVPPVAGGLVATYGEYDAFSYQTVAAHLVSLIAQGIFDQHPSLRALIVGTGAAWLPGQLWRLDWAARYAAMDAPWMTRNPSELFGAHVRVTTYGMEPAEGLIKVLQALGWADDAIVYASGWPHVTSAQAAAEVADRFPEAWRSRILADTALDLYRFPDRPAMAAEPARVSRTSMASLA
ncbi:MAG TPA: amidohydrolase family protein [Solirubrobacteraceae bacterium]|nr:amidohydrolase family protein [Solirubrobacteraceae bacterium]